MSLSQATFMWIHNDAQTNTQFVKYQLFLIRLSYYPVSTVANAERETCAVRQHN